MAAACSGLDVVASRFIEVFDCVCSDSGFLAEDNLDVALEGGGLFSRGEVGHAGDVCPDLGGLSVDLLLSGPASTLLGCNIGLWADKARCTAAAEGTVDNEPAKFRFLVGLNS